MNRQGVRILIALSVFAVVFLALTVGSFTQKSATWDEPFPVTGGYAALKYGDYRWSADHPPLLKMWCALPLLAMPGVRFEVGASPITNSVDWMFFRQMRDAAEFLYKQNDTERILYPARFMIALLGVLLGVLVFCWAYELFGFWPAVAALALYTVEPNLLAHAGLATTDFGIACFLFGAVYFLWRTTRKLTVWNVVGLSLFVALAAVSKFSAILLAPILGLLLLLRSWKKLPLLALLAVVAYGAVWAVYGFRYPASARFGDRIRLQHEAYIRQRIPTTATILTVADNHRLLPNACIQGFLFNQAQMQQRSAFLAGRYSAKGWWYFFPVAFLIKTPIPLLVLFLAGLGLCVWRYREWLADGLFLLLPPAVFMGAAMLTRINIGLRHVLPVYPFVILLAAYAAARLEIPFRRIAVCVLIVIATAESLIVFPDYLAYFNFLVGGSRHGYKYLVDSNLDWGQDLKGLKRWLDRQQTSAPVYLSYFGTAQPSYYRIEAKRLPGYHDFFGGAELMPLRGGIYCISATMLQCVYTPYPGVWSEDYEKLYQQTFQNVAIFERAQADPAARERLLREHGVPFWNQQFEAFNQLRFARLCAWLRRRAPDDQVGHSILIYRLTDHDLQEALFGPPATNPI